MSAAVNSAGLVAAAYHNGIQARYIVFIQALQQHCCLLRP